MSAHLGEGEEACGAVGPRLSSAILSSPCNAELFSTEFETAETSARACCGLTLVDACPTGLKIFVMGLLLSPNVDDVGSSS